MSPKRQALIGLIVGIVGIVAAAGMGYALVADDEGDGTDGGNATEDGFFVEPAGSIGPDAFTSSFAVGGSTICDKAKFLEELQGNPDALREWAEVLGITEDQVAAYVESLEPMVLDSDTKVTNHGLHDGQAYARQSLLVAGTAVLIDPNFPASGPPPNVLGVKGPPPTSSPTTTTVAGTPTPVTRCKCGNPLLPPYSFTPPTGSTTTTSSTTPSTTRPSGTTPPVTTGAVTTTSTPASTEPESVPMTTPADTPVTMM